MICSSCFLKFCSPFFCNFLINHPIIYRSIPTIIITSQDSRRDALAGIAAAGAALIPAAANAAAGESPRFSVFGLLGDGTSYSEGAAYGSDQSGKVYSPYSVYGEASADSLYKPDAPEFVAKKQAVLVETTKRLDRLEGYSKKKQWPEVQNELRRYMYETRSSITYLAKTPEQKKAAKEFYGAIERTSLGATQKDELKCTTGARDAVASFAELRKIF